MEVKKRGTRWRESRSKVQITEEEEKDETIQKRMSGIEGLKREIAESHSFVLMSLKEEGKKSWKKISFKEGKK